MRGTTKYAKGAKMGTQIVFKEETYKIITQLINYLKATGKQLGLLVNFGHYPKIEHERFTYQTLSRF
jgi:hypothetical protein